MHPLSIEYQPTDRLKLRASNPRTHSEKQIDQIATSIRRFGFTHPLIFDNEDNIVAGEGRLKAAKKLGLSPVPIVRLSNMSEAEIRAYVIADNKLAENAGWDRNILALELQYLSDLGLDDLDVTITGFEFPEIEVRLSVVVVMLAACRGRGGAMRQPRIALLSQYVFEFAARRVSRLCPRGLFSAKSSDARIYSLINLTSLLFFCENHR